ncbi:glycosyltransferase [Desulforhopalus singaporensis]|nr:glycosyltransferase [Desulforhopalus singaporensis]
MKKVVKDMLSSSLRFPLAVAKLRRLLAPAEKKDTQEQEALIEKDTEIIRSSGLFDVNYYLAAYPDVARSGIDPIYHFVVHGWLEGRDPSPDFSTKYYLGRYADVKEAGINPFLHYVSFGQYEGRHGSLESEQVFTGQLIPFWRYFPELDREDLSIDKIQLDVLYQSGKLCRHSIHVAILNGQLAFQKYEHPDISIIIPVHNQIDYTLQCIASIKNNVSPAVTYEVVVVDDASTDGTADMLQTIDGLRLIVNDNNLGFVGSCNNGAMAAKGNYLVFLNNDTIVLPGWLENLRKTFATIPGTGLCGSMLLYPNGLLQEAGGIIWKDGSGWNYGNRDKPYQPKYLFARDVDYCSGASIMVPRALFDELGRFDEIYSPGYYEDTDLAFKVREKGLRTVYQPFSRIVHFEGMTAGTDLNSGMKKYQLVNQEKFVKRWSEVLSGHDNPEDRTYYFQDRLAKNHVLVIDASTPTPDQDSGSNDTVIHMDFLQQAGFRVSFVPGANMLQFGKYTEDLQQRGIECIYSPDYYSLDNYLEREGWRYDLVWVYRWTMLDKYLADIEKYCPRAKVVFDTVDLHYLRQEREAKLRDDEKLRAVAEKVKTRELELMKEVDTTIVISEEEKNLLDRQEQVDNVVVLPMCRTIPGRVNKYSERGRNIVFIGGFQHSPNVDAVLYFVEHVWPVIYSKVPEATFLVAGSKAKEFLPPISADGVKVLGFVEDLTKLLENCVMTIAPLRFGAGVKGKTLSSLSHGVPTVLSSVAIEGTDIVPGKHCLLADTPAEYAAAVCTLLEDEQKWYDLSDAGLGLMNESYSMGKVQKKFTEILSGLGF